MKKLVILIGLMMVFTTSVAIAFDGPPEDLDKLNRNAEKKFHVRPWGRGGIKFEGGRTKAYSGTPEEAGEKFLKEYCRMLGISKDLKDVKLDRKGGIRGEIVHLDYQQYYEDVPVYMSGLKLTLDMRNSVVLILSSMNKIDHFNVDPYIKPDELDGILSRNNPPYGPIVGEPKLVIFFINDKPTLVYKLSAKNSATNEGFNFTIDANSGEILKGASSRTYFSSSDTVQGSGTLNKKIDKPKTKFSGVIHPKFGVKRNPDAVLGEITNPPGWGEGSSQEPGTPRNKVRTYTGDEARRILEKRGIKERVQQQTVKKAVSSNSRSNSSKLSLAPDTEEVADKEHLEQDHRVYRWPSVVRAVKARDLLTDKTEVDSLVYLAQKMAGRHKPSMLTNSNCVCLSVGFSMHT